MKISNMEAVSVHPRCRCCKNPFCSEECEKEVDKELKEYNSRIIEEEIDILAREKYPLEDGTEASHWNAHQCELREAFKEGYRKAKGLDYV